MSTQQERFEYWQSTVSDLEAEIEDLESERWSLEEKIDGIDSRLGDKRSELSNAKEEVARFEKAIADQLREETDPEFARQVALLRKKYGYATDKVSDYWRRA